MGQKYRKKKSSWVSKMFIGVFKYLMKAFGIGLFIFFLALVGVILYCHIFKTAKIYYYVYESKFLSVILIFIGVALGFLITFNYMMAVITNPGDTDGLKHFLEADIEETALQGVRNVEDDDDDSDGDTGNRNLPFSGGKCDKCDSFKPLRAHHCSVCGKCVLKMDHHCPWINNCVGHNNHRYFLLMIFWTLCGVFAFCIFALPIYWSNTFYSYLGRDSLYSTTAILCFALTIVLIPFNLWNWYLALSGQTAIEYWSIKTQEDIKKDGLEDPEPRIVDFRSKNQRDQLQLIFGTRSYFDMLWPKYLPLDFNGINWEPYINPAAIVKRRLKRRLKW